MTMTYQTPFSNDDLTLIAEALHRLLAVKRKAYNTMNATLRRVKQPPFHPRDFAIPQIEKLIKACGDLTEDEREPNGCRLINQDGKEIAAGAVFTDDRGEWTVESWYAKPAPSSGRVVVIDEHGERREFYPHVFGLRIEPM